MGRDTPTELLLIRHAPPLNEGRLAGRRDVDADCSDTAAFAAMRLRIGDTAHIVSSPARRCLQTARGIWPNLSPPTDARLWEQNFGDWEDFAFRDLPDLGKMNRAELAEVRPPNGENLFDVATRIRPALTDLMVHNGRVALSVHAHVIRAALGLALEDISAGMAFHIAPLSLTQITLVPNDQWAIGCINWTAP